MHTLVIDPPAARRNTWPACFGFAVSGSSEVKSLGSQAGETERVSAFNRQNHMESRALVWLNFHLPMLNRWSASPGALGVPVVLE
jgi:hypothetical protein